MLKSSENIRKSWRKSGFVILTKKNSPCTETQLFVCQIWMILCFIQSIVNLVSTGQYMFPLTASLILILAKIGALKGVKFSKLVNAVITEV